MAKLAKLLQAAAGAGTAGGLNVEEVFSTYLYTGNATAGTNITTGIDLSTEGGLLWTKKRSAAADHYLFDTETAAISGAFSKRLKSNATDPLGTEMNALTSFNTDGFTISTNGAVNGSGSDYCSWTFRKAPKFFDVVTYTGTGSAQNISHNLGSVPGVIIVKATSTTENWAVYHRSLGATKALRLNLTNAQTGSDAYWNNTEPTSTQFTVGNGGHTGANGVSYVAYLFAHNNSDGGFGPTGDQDIIKCGSYTSAPTGIVDLGFEPQWVMIKRASGTGDWVMFDAMRGLVVEGNDAYLYANTSGAEVSNTRLNITPTGFVTDTTDYRISSNGETYIYIAIRRGPMAVPTAGTDVFDIATRDGTEPHFNSNFDTVDFALYRSNISASNDWFAATRLTTNKVLRTDSTAAEIDGGTGFVMDFSGGWYGNSSANSSSYSWMWKRAPNYFDVVAYTGTGSARTIDHSLNVKPDMMWFKKRNSTSNWAVWHKNLTSTTNGYILLDQTSAEGTLSTAWNGTEPTASNFSLGTWSQVNQNNSTFICYLFASVDGVSKVGSYTGTGAAGNQIDCGFSSGARFVLIKAASAGGHWAVYDTERGIVAGNDSKLRLNSTDAAITNVDSIDPYNSGFELADSSGDTNTSGVTYIFYAIA
jgi:hypothetical protein